ncbi:MAG: haloacid dehalogenase [Bacillota bacterium]|nr:MAG: haloacid dehalogenase [Bacillota bacterium]
MKPNYKEYKINNAEFFEANGKTMCTLKQCGIETTYSVPDVKFTPKAEILLMDLDGTTVKSEEFWMYLMQLTVRRIMKNDSFCFADEDIPHIAGFSTYEHLEYCIKKYNIDCGVSAANEVYHEIAKFELNEILEGRGNAEAFKPREGLKEFLTEAKARGVKIGLATSGLFYKAVPEIVSAFRTLGMGDPVGFYDAIITGGSRKRGEYGTVGELAAKPHPWVYLELINSFGAFDPEKVVVLEDSSAGVLSARLAGLPVIGFRDGNLLKSRMDDLCVHTVSDFDAVKRLIF